MGSLMAGWHSNIPDSKEVKYQRNHSLTREEINTYWKSKKLKEEKEEYISDQETGIVLNDLQKKDDRSSWASVSNNNKERFVDMKSYDNKDNLENLILKNGWWMSSSSAFLNEPPVLIPMCSESEDEENEGKYINLYKKNDSN